MMIGLALTLCCLGFGSRTASLDASGDAELDAAGIAFTLPSKFERVAHEPPVLFAAISRRLATEQMRVSLFIVPAGEETVDASMALIDSRTVAAEIDFATSYGEVVESAPKDMPMIRTNTMGPITLLTVRRVGDRFLGMVVSIHDEKNAGDEEPALAAFREAKPSLALYPSQPGKTLSSPELGLKLDLPALYEGVPETALPRPSGNATFTPQWHLGVKAKLGFEVMGQDLDLPLDGAAKNLRDRLMAEVPLTTLTADEPFQAGLPAIHLGFVRGDAVIDVLVCETERRRFALIHYCEKSRFESMKAAILRSFQSVGAVDRRVRAELDEPYEDADAGFTIRPPTLFEKDGPGSYLVAYHEVDVRPPASRMAVTLAEENSSRPANDQAAIERANTRRAAVLKALSGEDYVAAGEVSATSYGGELAARYAIEQTTARGVIRSERTIVFGRTRSFEIAATAPKSEFATLGDVFAASVATFRTTVRKMQFALAPPVKSSDGSIAIRVPDDWKRIDAGSDHLAFEPMAAGSGMRIVAGVMDMPPEAPLVGPGERYRAAIEREITASGAMNVRVESASLVPGTVKQYLYRVAYSVGPVPMHQLRFAILQDTRVLYAAASCPDDAFATWRAALESSIRSLERPTP